MGMTSLIWMIEKWSQDWQVVEVGGKGRIMSDGIGCQESHQV